MLSQIEIDKVIKNFDFVCAINQEKRLNETGVNSDAYLIGLREGYEDGISIRKKKNKDYVSPLIQSDEEILEWRSGYEDGYTKGIITRSSSNAN